jgi:hypothetical protein
VVAHLANVNVRPSQAQAAGAARRIVSIRVVCESIRVGAFGGDGAIC